MSKLAEALFPRVVSRTDGPLAEHLEVTRRSESNPASGGTDYMLEARFFTRVKITEREVDASISDTAVKDRVFQMARQNIVEAVFGEFRQPLTELRVALVAGDLEKARAVQRRLEQQMFSVGIPL